METYQKRKVALILLTGFVGVVLISGLAWGVIAIISTMNQPPVAANPASQSGKEIQEYFESDEFRSLDKKQKAKYVKSMFEDEGNDDKYLAMIQKKPSKQQEEYYRKELGPVFREAFFMMAEEYCQKTPKEKRDYIDSFLDRMEDMQKKVEKLRKEGKIPDRPRGNNQNRGRRPGGPGGNPAQMKKLMDDIEPTRRAQMMQFVMDVMGRMRQRGMNPGPRR